MDNVTRLLMQGAAGAAGGSTYVDDVFSTYIYDGDGNSSHPITNNIDLSTNGGMTWIKRRDGTYDNWLMDSVRGGTKMLSSNRSDAEATNQAITSFNSDGFTLGNEGQTNASGTNFASWTFRKATGFFDIVTYTGNNGNDRQIAHNLGSVPGCIIIKVLTKSDNWAVYHRGMDSSSPENYGIFLNSNAPRQNGTNWWNNTAPTATHFTVGGAGWGNENGETFVAYIFAGGSSTAATARSVDFDGNTEALQLASNADLSPGTSDFTFECWLRPDAWGSSWETIYHNGVYDGFYVGKDSNNKFVVRASSNTSFIEQSTLPPIGQWTHIAVTRSGSTLRLFYNGVLKNSVSNSHNFSTAATGIAATAPSSGEAYDGEISNLRFVKGTALYTSSFRPLYEPLTNITNTKLLCCNNSSTTGSTVTPGTITANGSPTASTASPFDDTEGFQFGEGGDQNIIKCGRYDGVNTGPNIDVEIGWEPQFFMVKSATASSTEWLMWDSMRQVATDYNDNRLSPTELAAEYGGQNAIDFTSTGVRIRDGDARVNGGVPQSLMYIAIRRPDGYVGKPAEAATDVFFQNMLAAADDPSIRSSTFAGDMGLIKTTEVSNSWNLGTRLTFGRGLVTDSTAAEVSNSNWQFDYMNGANEYNNASVPFIAYLWKRHAGFDVVTYAGVPSTYSATGVGSIAVPHSLNAVPEMIWVKNRTYDDANGWAVYHKGLNGGTNPEQYRIRLQDTNTEDDNVGAWQDTAPTSTHFTLGTDRMVNQANFNYVAMLFSSVTGISKCGYYDGSNSVNTITTGFQPRFLIIKATTSAQSWFVLDTTRGWTGSGTDKGLKLNYANAQTNYDRGAPTSTGFTLTVDSAWNAAGIKYIYYAHA